MKTIAAGTLALALSTSAAMAWGDDGHKAVALIAEHYLMPPAKRQVEALLAADTDDLTKHDIASAATWADRWRDAHHRPFSPRSRQVWSTFDSGKTAASQRTDVEGQCTGNCPTCLEVLPAGTQTVCRQLTNGARAG